MKTVDGIFASAKIFNDNVENYAVAQIQMLCNNETAKGSKIRVMPDVHPGKVGTIGLTMTIGETIMPNLVGIDIGCGITLAKIRQKKVEFQKLDTVICEHIPTGFSVRKTPHRFSEDFDFSILRCYKNINAEKTRLSMGTLGGGNHFLELDKDDEGNLYVAIHSGSRHLGKEVTEYYLRKGQEALKQQGVQIPYELTVLTGSMMEDYLYDQQIVQRYAEENRHIILDELAKRMKWKMQEVITCTHNYIEVPSSDCGSQKHILRKGAISAKKGEQVIIPINMRDGILLGIGLGNAEWNYSAPHGSGRILKREDVKNKYTVSSFKKEMKGIHCSCISSGTLDEAPFAYRGLQEIVDAIGETVEISKILKPVYSYKAGN